MLSTFAAADLRQPATFRGQTAMDQLAAAAGPAFTEATAADAAPLRRAVSAATAPDALVASLAAAGFASGLAAASDQPRQ